MVFIELEQVLAGWPVKDCVSVGSAEVRQGIFLGLYFNGDLSRRLCYGKMYETSGVEIPTACAYSLSSLGGYTDYCPPSLRLLIWRSNVAMAANNLCNVAHLQASSNTEVTRLLQSTTSRQAFHLFVPHTPRRSIFIESACDEWITALHSVYDQPANLTTNEPSRTGKESVIAELAADLVGPARWMRGFLPWSLRASVFCTPLSPPHLATSWNLCHLRRGEIGLPLSALFWQ